MTVTFLFTDIEGSSPLRERLGERYFDLAAQHGRLLRAACAAHGGEDRGAPGDDSLFMVFAQATDALAAALAGQHALQAQPWPEGAAMPVRMGLHTAEAVLRDGIYDSVGINYARRICDAGHGGQLLLSQATRALVERHLPEGASLRDMGSHRFKGLEAPEQLFQVLHPELPAAFPALRTLDARPNNLPSQWTRFIGRERERAEVRALLAANRLLTLTGAGGSGKTRLALHVAAELLETFPDGVWLVELAALTDPELVAPALLSTLGAHRVVPLDTPRPPVAALTEALRTQAPLLLLDNCEHLLAACAALCETLLRHCPQLRILATSREALGITGEQTYRVPSLSLPEEMGVQVFGGSGVRADGTDGTDRTDGSDATPERPNPRTPERLMEYEAIRLFVDRTALIQPAFVLTAANAAAVVQICRRLDGIPLAIELAAARVRAMRVEQIAARLDDQFRLLTGGSRTALPRQQTLRALIDWSYDLLNAPERALLRRLSVFAGGWTLEAAEAVCDFGFWILDFGLGTEGSQGDNASILGFSDALPKVRIQNPKSKIQNPDVLDLLTQLVDKSLVGYQDTEDRYRLLETMRQYGRERLAEAGEEAAARQRHRDWYLALAEEAEPELTGPAEAAWLGRLEAEHDNLRAGLERSIERQDGEAALRLSAALWRFWHVRGHATEGLQRLRAALALPGAAAGTAARARALNAAGALAHDQRAYRQAAADHEESLRIARALPEPAIMAEALNHLGNAAAETAGQAGAARRHYQEALALWQELEDPAGIARALSNLGTLAQQRGDAAEAASCFEQSLALRQAQGNPGGIGVVLHNEGYRMLQQGELERATQLLEESLRLFRELGDRDKIAMALSNLADVALERGDRDRATALHRECLRLGIEDDDPAVVAASLEGLAAVAAREDRPLHSARLAGAAAAMRDAKGVTLAETERAAYERRLAAARSAVPTAEWEAAWADGQALPPARAMADALAD